MLPAIAEEHVLPQSSLTWGSSVSPQRRERAEVELDLKTAEALQGRRSGSMAAQVEAEPKRSPWERAVAKFGAYFEEQGLSAADVPAAIVIHEVVGLVMAAAFWASCYAVRPSQTVARPLVAAVAHSRHGAAMQAAYNKAMAQATATVQRLSWLRAAPGVDPTRLTVSLAESLCLRAAIKPATFPFKLWAAYKLTLLTKRWGRGAAGGGGSSSGGSGSKAGSKANRAR